MSANDRFKSRFVPAFWCSIAAAAVLHFLLLAYGPALAIDVSYRPATPGHLEVQGEEPPELPAEPPPIARPSLPVVGAELDADVSFASVSFRDYLPPAPPPAPSLGDAARVRETFEKFVPSMTAPRITNTAAVEQALQRHYPPLLRDAGIAGSVGVQLWLDEAGRVVDARVVRSSGYEAMDAAALHVADVMQLTPALNRGRPVRVIVVVPVVFRLR